MLPWEKKNCGRRNELLRCCCCFEPGCSGDERPDEEAIEEEDGDVEYMAKPELRSRDGPVRYVSRDIDPGVIGSETRVRRCRVAAVELRTTKFPAWASGLNMDDGV